MKKTGPSGGLEIDVQADFKFKEAGPGEKHHFKGLQLPSRLCALSRSSIRMHPGNACS